MALELLVSKQAAGDPFLEDGQFLVRKRRLVWRHRGVFDLKVMAFQSCWNQDCRPRRPRPSRRL
jgi:hypothetical protein